MKPLDIEIDTIKEILNLGVGNSAGILNTMLGSHIELSVPVVDIVETISKNNLTVKDHNLSVIDLPFSGELNGISKLVFPAESALKLVQLLTESQIDKNDSDFNAMRTEALSEIGNIVLNSVMGMFSNTLHINLRYSIPFYHETEVEDLIPTGESQESTTFLIAQVSFRVAKEDIQGDILILFRVGSYKTLQKLIQDMVHSE